MRAEFNQINKHTPSSGDISFLGFQPHVYPYYVSVRRPCKRAALYNIRSSLLNSYHFTKRSRHTKTCPKRRAALRRLPNMHICPEEQIFKTLHESRDGPPQSSSTSFTQPLRETFALWSTCFFLWTFFMERTLKLRVNIGERRKRRPKVMADGLRFMTGMTGFVGTKNIRKCRLHAVSWFLSDSLIKTGECIRLEIITSYFWSKLMPCFRHC